MPDENSAPAAPQAEPAPQPADEKSKERELFQKRKDAADLLGIPRLCARTWVEKASTTPLIRLWERYHDKFETPAMRKLNDSAAPDMRDLLRIPSVQLEGYEGRFKEEKIQDAMRKTSKLFMLHVVAAIRFNELRELNRKYRLG